MFIISDISHVFQAQNTPVIQLQRVRQHILQAMMLIKNSAQCHLLNLSTAKLRINKTNLLYMTLHVI